MTRFLSRLWTDPGCGTRNDQTERLFQYHQETKHTYQSVRSHARSLDWSNQPNPFRIYENAPCVALPPEPGFPDEGLFTAIGALAPAARPLLGNPDSAVLDQTWLSRFLWHAMAVSAWKRAPGTGGRYSLRVNPSSGNLHPTESYVALNGFGGIENGLYHYRADQHALELRSAGQWVPALSAALDLPSLAEAPLIVALTSIFWRESWKYGNRAYRYCCHDLGHAMMALLLSAQALGLPGGVIAHFSDLRLSRALGLDRGDEAPMAFLVFPAPERSNHPAVARDNSQLRPFADIPNQLSAHELAPELILQMHCATILPDPPGALPNPSASAAKGKLEAPPPAPESAAPARDASFSATVRSRRSALDFDPAAPPMLRADLEQLLDFSTRDWRADWRGNFGAAPPSERPGVDFISLYLYVHRVRDCEPGVYRWQPESRSLAPLHLGNVQRVAAFLSLEQSLAGNGCFAVSMVADLDAAAKAFGNRGYRYVYFEAGAIGQRLYLGAQALGWNATGIGAFYDDDVHRYLGFLEEHDQPVSASLEAAERSSLVMLGSPASREGAPSDTPNHIAPSNLQPDQTAHPLRSDSSNLPRQAIYHFSVGLAIFDPRLDAPRQEN